MGRTPAVQLAPGVWRIPTAPADLVNSFAFVDDDGQVTLVDAGVKRAPRRCDRAREVVRDFLREKAGEQ